MGTVHVCNAALKYMSKAHGGPGGVIILTASQAGIYNTPAM